MMLSKRLSKLVSKVPQCDTLLDVGCDHGFVAYELKTQGVAKNVMLSDISEKSLEKARELFAKNHIQAEFFVSDGIKSIQKKFDFCIIAGMGGLEIMNILQDGKIDNALLQPMNHIAELRLYLVQSGYKIVDDEIIFDGKFYNMINVKKGEDILTELEMMFGRTNLQNRSVDFVQYLKEQLRKKERILKGVPNGEKHDELSKYIDNIKELLK